MQSVEIARAVRKANLESAVLALLRFAQEEGYDGLEVSASVDDGQSVIDLSFTQKGVPMSGESL
ncbi:hypothetical protein [Variovorax sp. LT1R16]|uniref:hypothetical protein n=1 Tax=Variovorax sp. LT1R16 TaxID=3443728 RepID=UPI003F4744D3